MEPDTFSFSHRLKCMFLFKKLKKEKKKKKPFANRLTVNYLMLMLNERTNGGEL